MSAAERVIDILHGEVNLFHLAWRKRFWLFKAVAEFSPEGLAANKLLISTHGKCWRTNIGAGLVPVFRLLSIQLAFGIIRRIHVNQLHIPIGVRATSRDEQFRRERTSDRHVFLQNGR